MKQFGSIFLAAVLGSLITIAAFQWFTTDESKTIHYQANVPVSKVAYTVNEKGETVPLDFTQTAEQVTKAVVHIESTSKENPREVQSIPAPLREFFGGPQDRGNYSNKSTGSGVLINADGFIVTNNHVVRNAESVKVTLNDNRSFHAEIIGTDPDTDLAVLKVKENNLPFLSFVDSDQSKVGQWVLAVGNPFNLNSTVTAGIISAKGRNIGIVNNENANELGNTSIESFIQTDAAINPGNSGGALVDLNGGLLGINTAIASTTGAYAGYGFAVPSDIVSKVVEDLIKFGVVQRGWLGVSITNVDSEVAKRFDLDVIEGAYVAGLADKSSAKDAGVKEGDVIVKIDETPVKTSTAVTEYIGRKRPGDKVVLLINRKGKEVTYPVTLKSKDGNTSVVKADDKESVANLGVDLEDLDSKELKRLELTNGIRVKALRNGKITRATDIQEGFIIDKLNDTPVKSVKEFNDMLKKKKPGDLVILSGTYEDRPKEFNYAFRM